jgi:two-component system sensor histidine kinase AlgZ
VTAPPVLPDSELSAPTRPPFWLPLLAGLPIGVCMVVMALPVLGNSNAAAFRLLYLVAFLFWSLPLTWLQRRLWPRLAWWLAAPLLLAATYAMALATNGLSLLLGVLAGWESAAGFSAAALLRGRGVDGVWLALVAFCAVHAVVSYYAALKDEQARRMDTLARLRDAELRALRYQLQPHFLFNTLNAISALVATGRERDARQMISRLGDFLRATLESAGTHEVTLADELALTDSYLAIEQARLGERLRIEREIDEDSLHALVPHLLLQPLVENAIRHGLAPRLEPGRLQLRIRRDGTHLRVCLDNDRDASSGQALAECDRPGVGLRNVAERLQQLYGSTASLQAGPAGADRFEVRIVLPWREAAAGANSGAAP